MSKKGNKVSSYKDVVKFCRDCYENKVEGTFTVKQNDFGIAINDKKETLLSYQYENDEIKRFFIDWLEKRKSVAVCPCKENNYQFLINYMVLDLILTDCMLRNKGQAPSHSFKLKSKNGKIRDITAPNEEIKPILQEINTVLQLVYDKRNEKFQVAYKKGKSIKNNAAPHVNNKYVFKIDLHDFFPSCKKDYVIKYVKFLFKNTFNKEFILNRFLNIILINDALYIGNPISGTLANVIISKPVKYLKNICDKFDINFTVYADDMTFSSSKFLTKEFILDLFYRAFSAYEMQNDFTLSEHKCHGVTNQRRNITGVVVNHNDKLTCHRYMFNEIRQTIHQLSYGDESHYNYNRLHGLISFVSMIDESDKLKNLLLKYKETVLKYNLFNSEKLTAMAE